jgi:hypothetical protein
MKRKVQAKTYKEKFFGLFSGISGSLSFLGGWQVCHNLCLGIIALLSIIGITIVGMPLLFLQQYNVYFWSTAVLLLIPTFIMYWKSRKHMPSRLILFNVGIIIAAVPFIELQDYIIFFWLFGGALIFYSILTFAKNRWFKFIRHLST